MVIRTRTEAIKEGREAKGKGSKKREKRDRVEKFVYEEK